MGTTSSMADHCLTSSPVAVLPPVISHYALATNGDANSVSATAASLGNDKKVDGAEGERERESKRREEREVRAVVWLFHLRVTSISRNRAEYHECRSVSR